MQMANDRNMSIAEIKAELAKTTMELATQKELTVAAHVANAAGKRFDAAVNQIHAPQVAPSPAEPPQRAPAGEAFTQ
jgi:hypothetical protein